MGCNTPDLTENSSPTAPIETPADTAIPSPTPTATPTPDPVWSLTTLRERSFSINQITLDEDQNAWSAGSTGITHWNLESGSSRTFGVEDGLPVDQASGILTDREGQIWVSWVSQPFKGYGVSRYSQGEWTHFDRTTGLVDNQVNSMVLADDGKLWFATQNGISCFDGETWTSYTMDDGLPSDAVRIIATSLDGTIWAHTDAGVTSFDGMQWIDHDAVKDVVVHDIISTQDGRVWFATDNYIRFYDGESWYMSAGSGLKLFLSREYFSFAVATDGTLWARAVNSLAVFDGTRWFEFTSAMGMPVLFGRGLHAMPDGSLWIPTTFNGLLRMSDWRFIDEDTATASIDWLCVGELDEYSNGTYSIMDKKDETCLDKHILGEQVLETTEGDLIFVASSGFATAQNELAFLRKSGEFSVLTPDEFERDPNRPTYGVSEILSDGESLWVNSWGSLYQYNQHGWQNLSQDERRFDYPVLELGPDGRVWIGSKYGLSVWDNQDWIHWPAPLEDGSFQEMRVSAIGFHNEDVWVLDQRGLSRLAGGNLQEPAWTTIEPAAWKNQSGEGSMRFLEIDSQGGIWIGGKAPYPAYYDGVDWSASAQGLFKDGELTALEVAPNDSVWIGIKTNIEQDMAEELGENQYRLMHFDGSAWITDAEVPEHPDVALNDILITPDDEIWVAYHNGGIVRYDDANTNWEAFNTSNVLRTSDTAYHIFMETDGTMWFGLGDGYARYGAPE